MRTRDGIVIQQSAFAFLDKAFSDCVYRCKKHNDPKQHIPNNGVTLTPLKASTQVEGDIANKHCRRHIKQNPIEGILGAPLQQYFLFDEIEGLVKQFHFGAKIGLLSLKQKGESRKLHVIS